MGVISAVIVGLILVPQDHPARYSRRLPQRIRLSKMCVLCFHRTACSADLLALGLSTICTDVQFLHCLDWSTRRDYDLQQVRYVPKRQRQNTHVFTNSLLRLRQELTNLITVHTDKIADPTAKATVQSTIYEAVLQGLSKGSQQVSHPKAQSEVAFWKEREEQARRRILSMRRQR